MALKEKCHHINSVTQQSDVCQTEISGFIEYAGGADLAYEASIKRDGVERTVPPQQQRQTASQTVVR